ncbi:hypothetical protein [Marinobacter sp. F4216]|uniref:hypothetical protein n=1 Tax=Marinobacter sp. F4216 TaxID=2874281 RepID=UPI001CBFA8F1|nr:hypothetical protein [Marinobacter sp. F4216]MBZ2169522.1 hypothetical protein [Marinobacter sp. F4216]
MLADEFGDLEDPDSTIKSDLTAPYSQLVRQSKPHPSFHKLVAITDDHGFDSPEAFGLIADQIFLTYGVIQLKSDPHAQQIRQHFSMPATAQSLEDSADEYLQRACRRK